MRCEVTTNQRTWKAANTWCGCLAAAWFQSGPAQEDDKVMLGEWVLAGYRISSTTKLVRVGRACRLHSVAYWLTRLLKGVGCLVGW